MNVASDAAPLALTVTAVARTLGVSAGTVRRWADEGALACSRTPGGQRRFSRADVEAFAATLRAGAGAKR